VQRNLSDSYRGHERRRSIDGAHPGHLVLAGERDRETSCINVSVLPTPSTRYQNATLYASVMCSNDGNESSRWIMNSHKPTRAGGVV